MTENQRSVPLSLCFSPQQAGSVIRLFHRELEAYVCAEGSFAEKQLTEDGEK